MDLKGPIYNKAGTIALYTMPQSEDDDNFKHLTYFDSSTMSIFRLTKGKRVVDGFVAWDEINNLMWESRIFNAFYKLIGSKFLVIIMVLV